MPALSLGIGGSWSSGDDATANSVFTTPVPGNSMFPWHFSLLQPVVEEPRLAGVQLLDPEDDEKVISDVPEAEGIVFAVTPVVSMGERFQSTCSWKDELRLCGVNNSVVGVISLEVSMREVAPWVQDAGGFRRPRTTGRRGQGPRGEAVVSRGKGEVASPRRTGDLLLQAVADSLSASLTLTSSLVMPSDLLVGKLRSLSGTTTSSKRLFAPSDRRNEEPGGPSAGGDATEVASTAQVPCEPGVAGEFGGSVGAEALLRTLGGVLSAGETGGARSDTVEESRTVCGDCVMQLSSPQAVLPPGLAAGAEQIEEKSSVLWVSFGKTSGGLPTTVRSTGAGGGEGAARTPPWLSTKEPEVAGMEPAVVLPSSAGLPQGPSLPRQVMKDGEGISSSDGSACLDSCWAPLGRTSSE